MKGCVILNQKPIKNTLYKLHVTYQNKMKTFYFENMTFQKRSLRRYDCSKQNKNKNTPKML